MKKDALIFVDTRTFQRHKRSERRNASFISIMDSVGWSESDSVLYIAGGSSRADQETWI